MADKFGRSFAQAFNPVFSQAFDTAAQERAQKDALAEERAYQDRVRKEQQARADAMFKAMNVRQDVAQNREQAIALGQIALQQGRYDEAQKMFDYAGQPIENLVGVTETPTEHAKRAQTFLNVINMPVEERNLEGLDPKYQQSLEQFEQFTPEQQKSALGQLEKRAQQVDTSTQVKALPKVDVSLSDELKKRRDELSELERLKGELTVERLRKEIAKLDKPSSKKGEGALDVFKMFNQRAESLVAQKEKLLEERAATAKQLFKLPEDDPKRKELEGKLRLIDFRIDNYDDHSGLGKINAALNAAATNISAAAFGLDTSGFDRGLGIDQIKTRGEADILLSQYYKKFGNQIEEKVRAELKKENPDLPDEKLNSLATKYAQRYALNELFARHPEMKALYPELKTLEELNRELEKEKGVSLGTTLRDTINMMGKTAKAISKASSFEWLE